MWKEISPSRACNTRLVLIFLIAKFCLLEQCLPNGPNHPFAFTMLKHFQKLSSPLRVIQTYQTIESQQNRFRDHGWARVRADSLWDVWRDGQVFSPTERYSLRSIETFDEHEEFALFATHYFLLTASSTGNGKAQNSIPNLPGVVFHLEEFLNTTSKLSPRRYGAAYEIQDEALVYHGGDNGRSRLATTQIYLNKDKPDIKIEAQQERISPRVYHTITKLNFSNDCLLVGGRDSPEKILRDCWLRKNGHWVRVGDLPIPLFRHSATLVSNANDNGPHAQSGVVVFGGKTRHDQDSNAWFLWDENQGWRMLSVTTSNASPRFSANLLYFQDERVGILLGGMTSSEVVANEAFTWSIDETTISLSKLDVSNFYESDRRLFRFGAVLIRYRDFLLLIGGIAEEGLPRADPESKGDILAIGLSILQDHQGKPLLELMPCESPTVVTSDIRQPLLIGHSAILQNDMVHIMGGGAICYSFGSFMNFTSWHISREGDTRFVVSTGQLTEPSKTAFRSSIATEGQNDAEEKRIRVEQEDNEHREHDKPTATTRFIAVNRVVSKAEENLSRRVTKRKPCVFEEVDLGDCTWKWTPEYLKQALGSERLFDVHHAMGDTMLFESKNFEIRKESFSNFMDTIVAGEKKYLRAVSFQDKHKPANFYQDFEELSTDFRLPRHLTISEEQQHSSVFRVSGAINMWLHYDTLSNVLCQIRGSKRLLLFAPADVAHLKIPPGRSSSDLNVFDPQAWEKTSLRHTHPYEVILRPGDVIYIPPLWCHAALPLDGLSIAINTFFKTKDDQSYALGRDTYGNKDVAEYEHARKDITKAIGRFSSMSKDTRRFYLERLADEMLQEGRKKD